jgi:hypothetical protein
MKQVGQIEAHKARRPQVRCVQSQERAAKHEISKAGGLVPFAVDGRRGGYAKLWTFAVGLEKSSYWHFGAKQAVPAQR